MSVCKHPNNVEYIPSKCNKDSKHDICYGSSSDIFKNEQEVEEYVIGIEKDATKTEELSKLFTPGCWDNISNKPFIKDFQKNDEKDPIKCITTNKKWITGDGYTITKKEDADNIKDDTASKIKVNCSPGYEGEPGIEINSCEDYTSFKAGDDGMYQQFSLSGCDICPMKYGGNNNDKDDKSCYAQCGSSGTTIFEGSASNDKLQFIDTNLLTEFKIGEKREGYCCDHVSNSISVTRLNETEIQEGSNYFGCSVNKCRTGYVRDNMGQNCCRKINNSKDDVEYMCDMDSENTEPIDKTLNYCKDGFYPQHKLTSDGLYNCIKCETIDGTHIDAEVTCDINGGNVHIKPDSQFKCNDDGSTYYDEGGMKCSKCPYNKKINDSYVKGNQGSNICVCKDEYLLDGDCIQCIGENIEYNKEYKNNNKSKCKCVIDDKNFELPENVLIGECHNKELYKGESCNLICEPGYTLSGKQPTCYGGYLDKGDVSCIIETAPASGDENDGAQEEIIEGFTDMFSKKTKRLLLLFILIMLILQLF